MNPSVLERGIVVQALLEQGVSEQAIAGDRTVEQIANAVLYEGYMLYPYRPSSVKNKKRWNFGVLCPQQVSEARGGFDAWEMQTQCLITGGRETRLHVRVRFLRTVHRQIGRFPVPLAAGSGPFLPDALLPDYEEVQTLRSGGRTFHTWEEARETEVEVEGKTFGGVLQHDAVKQFTLPEERLVEPIAGDGQTLAGVIVRRTEPLAGFVHVRVENIAERLYRLTVTIHNATLVGEDRLASATGREDSHGQSMLSTHAILRAEDGEFVSLLEPPEECRLAAQDCHNSGLWPVLIGTEGSRDTVFASPVILYDYPAIAPESPGDLFDGTEIDEILSLRILTLTDDEKREIRESDERASAVLDRTENLPQEHFQKLHGAVRRLHPLAKEGE